MKEFTTTLPWMYFEGIKNGDISVIFFEKSVLKDAKRGDLIHLSHIDSEVKTYFDSAKLITFGDVTDEIAKKAGFVNKELLSAHLMDRFNIKTFDFSTPHSKIDDEIFYLLFITDDPSEISSDGEVPMKMAKVPGSMVKTYYPTKCNSTLSCEKWRH